MPTALKQAGLLLLGVVIATVMVLLGIWQLDVYQAQGEATAAARVAAPPVPLASVAVAGQDVGDGFGRTVTFTGTYDPELQLLVADPDGGPSRVLTGLVLADGSVLPVVRGSVRAGVSGAPAPPSGPVTGSGVFLPSESSTSGPVPAGSTGNTPAGQLVGVQLAAVAQQWSPPLIGGFATLSPAESTAEGLTPAAVELPQSQGRLRNGAYALQWWVFAAFALLVAAKMARDVGRAADWAEVTDPAEGSDDREPSSA